jgi:ATP-binding cassette, subfamily B (MDR/TAP), member 1
MTLSMFVVGFAIAFAYGWLMTLVVLCSIPVIGLGGALFAFAAENKSTEEEKEYSHAGGQAEQAIASIKTVKQLNGEKYESVKYRNTLVNVTKNSTKHGVFLGLGMGTLFFSILASYALGFWYGSLCVEGASGCSPDLNGGSKYTAGDVLVVFFSVLMAGFNLSQLTPSIRKIS